MRPTWDQHSFPIALAAGPAGLQPSGDNPHPALALPVNVMSDLSVALPGQFMHSKKIHQAAMQISGHAGLPHKVRLMHPQYQMGAAARTCSFRLPDLI